MAELIIGIVGGVLLDGAVTMGAIKMLQRWNRKTLDDASSAFEDKVRELSTEIVLNAVKQMSGNNDPSN